MTITAPPWNFTPAIWVLMAPWLFALRQHCKTRKQALGAGVLLGSLASLGLFPWVAYSIHQFGGVPWPLALLGLLLFSFYGEIQFVVFAPIYWEVSRNPQIKNRPVISAVLVALLYTGIDWALPKLWRDTLGHGFSFSPWIRQAADLGGAHLLTFCVVFVNETLSRILTLPRPHLGFAHLRRPEVRVSIGLITSLLIYGAIRERQIQHLYSPDGGAKSLRLAAIQANIGDFDKVAAETGFHGAADRIVETFLSYSTSAATEGDSTHRPHAVIWPETAYPATFGTPISDNERARERSIRNWVNQNRISLWFGGYDTQGGKDFNSFFFLSPRPSSEPSDPKEFDQELITYHKHILLMFGEYIPGADWIPAIKRWFPQVGYFGQGPGPEALALTTLNPETPVVKVGPIICYEALFPNFILGAARKGSQLILNITNDSWFGPYGEPHLHLSLTVFRSIESRLPQLRSTNTGVSTLILPTGQQVDPTEVFVPAVLNVSVPLRERAPWTLMQAWGDWFGPFALISGLLGVLGVLLIPALSRSRRLSKP